MKIHSTEKHSMYQNQYLTNDDILSFLLHRPFSKTFLSKFPFCQSHIIRFVHSWFKFGSFMKLFVPCSAFFFCFKSLLLALTEMHSETNLGKNCLRACLQLELSS